MKCLHCKEPIPKYKYCSYACSYADAHKHIKSCWDYNLVPSRNFLPKPTEVVCLYCGVEPKNKDLYYLKLYECRCLFPAKISAKLNAYDHFYSELSRLNIGIELYGEYTSMNGVIPYKCLGCGTKSQTCAKFILDGRFCRRCGGARRIQNNIKKFGTKQNPHAVKAFRKTMMSRYGVPYALQNPDIFQKMVESSYNKKVFTLKGRKFTVQGYEPAAIRILVKDFGVDPKTINDSPPYFDYTNSNGKPARYFPDLQVGDKIVEVKSVYTVGADANLNLKLRAVQALGYTPVLMVINKSQTLNKRYKYDPESGQVCHYSKSGVGKKINTSKRVRPRGKWHP